MGRWPRLNQSIETACSRFASPVTFFIVQGIPSYILFHLFLFLLICQYTILTLGLWSIILAIIMNNFVHTGSCNNKLSWVLLLLVFLSRWNDFEVYVPVLPIVESIYFHWINRFRQDSSFLITTGPQLFISIWPILNLILQYFLQLFFFCFFLLVLNFSNSWSMTSGPQIGRFLLLALWTVCKCHITLTSYYIIFILLF